jgi:hypothetical protein
MDVRFAKPLGPSGSFARNEQKVAKNVNFNVWTRRAYD